MFGTCAIPKAPRNDPEYPQPLTNHIMTLYNRKNTLCVIYHSQWTQNRLFHSKSQVDTSLSWGTQTSQNVCFSSKNQCLVLMRPSRRPGTSRSIPNHLPTMYGHFTIRKTLSAWFNRAQRSQNQLFKPNLKATQVCQQALKPTKMCVFPRKINVWYLFDRWKVGFEIAEHG